MTEWLNTEAVECGDLLMRPDACHGCRYNPARDTSQEDARLAESLGWDIDNLLRLNDALDLGLNLSMSEITESEFDRLRVLKRVIAEMRSDAARDAQSGGTTTHPSN